MAPDQSSSYGCPGLWRYGLWFALLTGIGQTLLVWGMRSTTSTLIRVSPDAGWRATLANAIMFGVVAVFLQLVTSRLKRPIAAALSFSILSFLVLLAPVKLIPQLHFYAALILAVGLAAQGGRLICARIDRFDRLIRLTLPWLMILGILLGMQPTLYRTAMAQWMEMSLPEAAPGAPNVILIVLDTVRASSMSLYGYNRKTTPHLDEFAQTGVVFERALSTSPWTLPSHASFFTGRLPNELSGDWLTPLDRTPTTLAEVFASKGYLTQGFVANLLYATAETGLNRGFLGYSDVPLSRGMLVRDSWHVRSVIDSLRGIAGDAAHLWIRNRESSIPNSSRPRVRKLASDVNAEFLAWIASRPQKPFFAFLNYFDVHEPYLPPPPFDKKFGKGGPLPDLLALQNWSPQETQRFIDAYDGAVSYLDQQLGLLLDALKSQGLLEKTLIIITADHGEQLGEHGLFSHGNALYSALLHVPLIVSFPPLVPGGVRISEPVSLVDLPATILDLTKVATPGRPIPGTSIANYWNSSRDALVRPLFAMVSKTINMPAWLPSSKGSMQSVIIEGMHYIRNGDGREELYDLEHDAKEVRNLANLALSRPLLERARRALRALK